MTVSSTHLLEAGDPNGYETLIVWPIGPEGELEPGGFFKRRVAPE